MVDYKDPGWRNHRAYVGPERQYDLLGASQFRLLCALGLRSSHRVLDFGCGSLRAGRLLIPYLDPGRYFGVEPHGWLVEEAIEKETGRDLIELKRPRFDRNEDFRVDVFDERFDFILAQSIFSHCGQDLIARALERFAVQLADRGLIAATFVEGVDFPGSGWVYPKCATHSRARIHALARAAGLHGLPIPWFHPRQSWWLLAADKNRLPTPAQARLLHGVVLGVDEFSASWSRAQAVRKGLSRWYKYRVLARLRGLLSSRTGSGGI